MSNSQSKQHKHKHKRSNSNDNSNDNNESREKDLKRLEKRRRKEAKKEKRKEKKSKKPKLEKDSAIIPVEDNRQPLIKKKKPPPLSTTVAEPSISPTLPPLRPMVESSAFFPPTQKPPADHNITLCLFYRYIEPELDDATYKKALKHVQHIAESCHVAGRMRIAKEGLNCTLTTTGKQDMYDFIAKLREWKPAHFNNATEFKLTHHLPAAQGFRDLKVIPVVELVHYGLEGNKAPPIAQFHGTHLEPVDYHKKLAERNTVVIDVRNHYEAVIGHFQPPLQLEQDDFGDTTTTTTTTHDDKQQVLLPPPKYIDPGWRKSTEFPVWLDKPETQQELKGKQVLMFCTGGIRCERASALLKYKMETDPNIKGLGIQGVYQLQGGIDKYFKEFPNGGYWKGKNHVFDKRYMHAPVEKEAAARGVKLASSTGSSSSATTTTTTIEPDAPMGKCEACGKNWDQFRGKRRCPTCGVPSLICRDCWQADQEGKRKLDRTIRCDLCVKQDIKSKRELREREKREIEEYERRSRERGLLFPSTRAATAINTSDSNIGVTRLFLKNMCRNNMTEEILMDFLPGITHIVWRTDRKTGQFFGQGWLEMDSPESAAAAVAQSGEKVLGRPLQISFQKPDSKDAWPPPSSAVKSMRSVGKM